MELNTGTVVFTLANGGTLEFDNVLVDSVGPSAEAPGVIGVEFPDSDRVVHVPFVSFWEFSYDESDRAIAYLRGLLTDIDEPPF